MIKIAQTVFVMAAVLGLAPHLFWQQLRPRLGEDKAAAVESMLAVAFPGTTPVWDVHLYALASDGTRKRMSLTNIAAVTSGSINELVAGLGDFDAGDMELSKLSRGDVSSANRPRQTLVAVAKNSSGYYHPVASLVLDPNHMFSAITRLDSDPASTSQILMAYETTDVIHDQIIEMTWYAVLDANLKILQKWPAAIEAQGTGQNRGVLLRSLIVSRSSTGIVINDPLAKRTTQIACPAICEPTIEQLLANN